MLFHRRSSSETQAPFHASDPGDNGTNRGRCSSSRRGNAARVFILFVKLVNVNDM